MAIVQLRFDPNPMEDAILPGAERYPDLQANSWIPPISKSECLVLGFPWGAWNEGEIDREQHDPRLHVPLKDLPEEERRIGLHDLLRGHALLDDDVWAWTSKPGRTLVWVLPPPVYPKEITTPWRACLAQASSAFLRILGSRVSVIDREEHSHPEEYLPREDGWWRLLGPLETTAGFRLATPEPVDPGTVAAHAPAHTGKRRALTDLRLLAASPGGDDEGLALAGTHGEGRMVFLFASLPSDGDGVSRLREVALSLHEELWGRSLPELTPPDVRVTISLKEVAQLLSNVRFEGQKWTPNALRKRMGRAKAGPFVAFQAARVPDGRGRLYRDKFYAVLRPLLESIAKGWDESVMTLREIKKARDALARFQSEPK